MVTKYQIIKNLLNIKGVVIYEPTTLASGKLSEYYVDIKRSYAEAEILIKYVEYIIDLVGPEIKNISCVVGSGHGGIPLATAVSLHPALRHIKLSLIRDKVKNHGRPTLADGQPLEELDKDKKILIVDDVFTTGGSIKKDVLKVLPEDLGIVIVVVCNRSGIVDPEINGVKVNYIITPDDLKSL